MSLQGIQAAKQAAAPLATARLPTARLASLWCSLQAAARAVERAQLVDRPGTVQVR